MSADLVALRGYRGGSVRRDRAGDHPCRVRTRDRARPCVACTVTQCWIRRPSCTVTSSWRSRTAIACWRFMPTVNFVAAGGLMSYGIDNIEPYRQAPSYIDRILRGAKSAELPGTGASQIRDGPQPQDRESAGLYRAARLACRRRRGDRTGCILPRRTLSANGTERRFERSL
jgi:hypothetical protein